MRRFRRIYRQIGSASPFSTFVGTRIQGEGETTPAQGGPGGPTRFNFAPRRHSSAAFVTAELSRA